MKGLCMDKKGMSIMSEGETGIHKTRWDFDTGDFFCSCAGFHFRGRCRHIEELYMMMRRVME